MGWIDRGNLRGPAGTFQSVSAKTLAPGASATATIGGTLQNRTVEFGIPQGAQGLPGVNAVDNDGAVAGYISTPGNSATKTALSTAYGFTIVADATTATTDQTGVIMAALAAHTSVRLMAGSSGLFRVEGTIVIGENQVLYLGPGVTIQRPAPTSTSDPVIWMNANTGVLSGAGMLQSVISSQGPTPTGVVCVGNKGAADSVGRQANFNTVANLDIIGMTYGGQTAGAPDIALLLCNNYIGGMTSYFNTIHDLRLIAANVGLQLLGGSNANFIDNILLYQVGNGKQLAGAGVKLSVTSGINAPMENHISGVFHHQSLDATSIYLDGPCVYNMLTNVICEQGGVAAQFFRNNDTGAIGNTITGIDNVGGSSTFTTDFTVKNTVMRRTIWQGQSLVIGTLNTVGASTVGAFVEKSLTLTGLVENSKTSFLKATVPAGSGSYLVEISGTLGSATSAALLQTGFRAIYSVEATATVVTVKEISALATNTTLLAPVVSARDVTFGVAAGNNGTSTAVGVLSVRYKAPTALTFTELNTASAAAIRPAQFALTTNQGFTAARPTARTVGDQFFDRTLGKPIWWNAANWVDAAGTVV